MGGEGSGIGTRTSVKFTPEIRQRVIDMIGEGQEIFTVARELGVTKRMLFYRCRKEITLGREIAAENGILPKSTHLVQSREDVPEETKFQIETLAAYGLPIHQIATVVGMAEQTLHAYCMEDIDRGRASGHDVVAGKLFDMASDGEHPVQTQFYLTHRCKWREDPKQIEFPDGQGNPQNIANTNIVVDPEKLQAIIAALNEKV